MIVESEPAQAQSMRARRQTTQALRAVFGSRARKRRIAAVHRWRLTAHIVRKSVLGFASCVVTDRTLGARNPR
jgi:hypothetical protein